MCLFFLTCLCSNLELANFVNNFLIDLSWPHYNTVHADKTELPHWGTYHMNDIRWMRINWMIELHAPHTITQYKINGCACTIIMYIHIVTDVTVSTCMSLILHQLHDHGWYVLQLGITELVWNHGRTPYYHGRTLRYHYSWLQYAFLMQLMTKC